MCLVVILKSEMLIILNRNKREKKVMKYILILIVVLIMALGSYRGKNDSLDNIPKENNIKTEYKSEHGFGNDAFNIYSFNVVKEFNTDDFKKIDDKYQNISNHFKDMLESKYRNSNYSNKTLYEIQTKLDLLEKEEDCLYMYITDETGARRELYIYSKQLNIGYYFLLQI